MQDLPLEEMAAGALLIMAVQAIVCAFASVLRPQAQWALPAMMWSMFWVLVIGVPLNLMPG